MRATQNDFKLIQGLFADLPDPAEMPLGTAFYATDTDALFILEINPVTGVRVWGALGGGSGGPFVETNGTTPLTANWDVGGFQLKNVANPTAPQDAATKSYVDAADAILAAYIDGNFVKTDGTTPLTGNWNVGGFQLKNLADPTSAQDAATKAYVDRTSGGTSQSKSTNFTADPLISTYYLDADGLTITLPSTAPVGTSWNFISTTGSLTPNHIFSPNGGLTINGAGTTTFPAQQWGGVTVERTSSTTWQMVL